MNKKAEKPPCLVMIFDKVYDLSKWAIKHPGGNLFKHGQDMSLVYKSHHGTDVNQLHKFIANETQVSEFNKAKSQKVESNATGKFSATTLIEGAEIGDTTTQKLYDMKDLDKALDEELNDDL